MTPSGFPIGQILDGNRQRFSDGGIDRGLLRDLFGFLGLDLVYPNRGADLNPFYLGALDFNIAVDAVNMNLLGVQIDRNLDHRPLLPKPFLHAKLRSGGSQVQADAIP
ncbi:hypothetical protein D1872_248840 [compost metagenome]